MHTAKARHVMIHSSRPCLLPLLLERRIAIDVLALADEEGALKELEDFVDETEVILAAILL